METAPTKERMLVAEEELAYLRGQFEKQKQENISSAKMGDEKTLSHAVVRSYAEAHPRELWGAGHTAAETVIAGLALKIAPEPHDVRMEELYRVIQTKGIYTALKVVEKMNDPHLEDDFHRFVAELVRGAHGVKGLKEKTELSRSVSRVLFEISLSRNKDEGDKGGSGQGLRELVSKMESIYAILQGHEKDRETIVLELANSAGNSELVFYAAVPGTWANRFENEIRTVYPEARVNERPDDYNVFAQGGHIALSSAKLSRSAALPLKTFETFEHDPMNLLIGAFGKLHHENEGALVQIVVGAASSSFEKTVRGKKSAIEKGADPKEVLAERGVLSEIFGMFGDMFKNSGGKKKEEKESSLQKHAAVLQKLESKLARPISTVWMRVAASAATRERAEAIGRDIESSFRQFSEPTGNEIIFKKVRPREMRRAVRAISFRLPSFGDALYLNTAELATIFHFESAGLTASPTLKTAQSVSHAAPLDVPKEGILMGVNGTAPDQKEIFLADTDRLRHLYVIGQTGTGKSTLLKNIVIQDVERGHGVCFIDPHGSDIEEILSRIPPERQKDVIYFDPANLEYPIALNMLEYDARFPEQKTFVVNELFAIFQKLYGAVPESMGPMFEQYFRNATLLTIEDPESGSTLLHVSRVLADKAYREHKLSRCKNPVVVSFWKEIAAKAGGEASLANIVPYITSKFDVFLANDYMRPIISQEKSSLRFREIIDEKKILLVNLSKGRLGEINSNLLGLIIVGKLLMAALSRVDVSADTRNPFHLVIDEFQNVTTDSLATIFSEARKYALSLTVAHQYIAQLTENISKAVFGNVGTLAIFRVGTDDAEYLEKQLSPAFGAADLANLPNGMAALKILANGIPLPPFDIHTFGFAKGNSDGQALKEASAHKYGTPREEVDKIINSSFTPAS